METDFSSQRLCSCVLRIWWKISFTTLFVWTLFYVFLFCRVVKQCLTFALNCSAINRQTNRAFSDIWCLSPELCHAPDPELWCDFQPIRRQCERLLTNQKPDSITYKIQVSPKWDTYCHRWLESFRIFRNISIKIFYASFHSKVNKRQKVLYVQDKYFASVQHSIWNCMNDNLLIKAPSSLCWRNWFKFPPWDGYWRSELSSPPSEPSDWLLSSPEASDWLRVGMTRVMSQPSHSPWSHLPQSDSPGHAHRISRG